MYLHRFILLVMILCALIITGCPENKAQLHVHYNVSITLPHNHIISVGMQIENVDLEKIDISMPVWTPGKYLILEHSKYVFGAQALDSEARGVADK